MRVAVVTGVGRRAGIGFAIARRLLDDGYRVVAHAWPAAEAAVRDELGGDVVWVEEDFADPDAPQRVIDAAVGAFGAVDVLVANHARDSGFSLHEVTAEELDLTFAVNARADVLLVKAFAAQGRRDGRVVLFTSGQHLGPMTDELPYAISKGAVHQMTRSLAAAVAGQGITVNAVNPGPVDTGWPSDELREQLKASFPAGRWGRPEDIAPVVAWLASEDSGWVTGQVIDAEGGFRR
jgi:3-oxoacyl-[acyl-carrier protein] reductase